MQADHNNPVDETMHLGGGEPTMCPRCGGWVTPTVMPCICDDQSQPDARARLDAALDDLWLGVYLDDPASGKTRVLNAVEEIERAANMAGFQEAITTLNEWIDAAQKRRLVRGKDGER